MKLTHQERGYVYSANIAETKRRADLDRLIGWYFGPEDARMARWVAWQVSGYSPLAYHRNGDAGVGLFDITPEQAGLDPSQEWMLHSPIRNVAAAHKVWCAEGWSHWQVPDPPPLWDVERQEGE